MKNRPLSPNQNGREIFSTTPLGMDSTNKLCDPKTQKPAIFYSKILFSKSKIKEISIESGIKKWKVLEVIKRYSKPCSTIFLIRENMFNLLDSVTLAALRFELSCHQKKMTLKIFCKIRNATFSNQTSRCLFSKIRNCQFTKFLAE